MFIIVLCMPDPGTGDRTAGRNRNVPCHCSAAGIVSGTTNVMLIQTVFAVDFQSGTVTNGHVCCRTAIPDPDHISCSGDVDCTGKFAGDIGKDISPVAVQVCDFSTLSDNDTVITAVVHINRSRRTAHMDIDQSIGIDCCNVDITAAAHLEHTVILCGDMGTGPAGSDHKAGRSAGGDCIDRCILHNTTIKSGHIAIIVLYLKTDRVQRTGEMQVIRRADHITAQNIQRSRVITDMSHQVIVGGGDITAVCTDLVRRNLELCHCTGLHRHVGRSSQTGQSTAGRNRNVIGNSSECHSVNIEIHIQYSMTADRDITCRTRLHMQCAGFPGRSTRLDRKDTNIFHDTIVLHIQSTAGNNGIMQFMGTICSATNSRRSYQMKICTGGDHSACKIQRCVRCMVDMSEIKGGSIGMIPRAIQKGFAHCHIGDHTIPGQISAISFDFHNVCRTTCTNTHNTAIQRGIGCQRTNTHTHRTVLKNDIGRRTGIERFIGYSFTRHEVQRTAIDSHIRNSCTEITCPRRRHRGTI